MQDYAQRHGQDLETALDPVLADYFAHERREYAVTVTMPRSYEDAQRGGVKPSAEVYASCLSPEEWMREYRASTHSPDRKMFPVLSNEDISSDSIYD